MTRLTIKTMNPFLFLTIVITLMATSTGCIVHERRREHSHTVIVEPRPVVVRPPIIIVRPPEVIVR